MTETGNPPLLDVRGVKTYYGKIVALRGVDITVNQGEIVTMIGANGAGKSTLMMTIFGKPQAREGQILFDGRDITTMPTHEIARLKIAQSPEGRRIFPRMTVMENLQMGASVDQERHFAEDLPKIFALFPRLKERADNEAGVLSGGEQQMLTLCRTLMGDPALVMIDEPTEGLAPKIVEQVARLFEEIRKRGVSILLVEQKLAIALDISERLYVMGHGHIVFEGKPRDVRENAAMRKEWLEV